MVDSFPARFTLLPIRDPLAAATGTEVGVGGRGLGGSEAGICSLAIAAGEALEALAAVTVGAKPARCEGGVFCIAAIIDCTHRPVRGNRVEQGKRGAPPTNRGPLPLMALVVL